MNSTDRAARKLIQFEYFVRNTLFGVKNCSPLGAHASADHADRILGLQSPWIPHFTRKRVSLHRRTRLLRSVSYFRMSYFAIYRHYRGPETLCLWKSNMCTGVVIGFLFFVYARASLPPWRGSVLFQGGWESDVSNTGSGGCCSVDQPFHDCSMGLPKIHSDIFQAEARHIFPVTNGESNWMWRGVADPHQHISSYRGTGVCVVLMYLWKRERMNFVVGVLSFTKPHSILQFKNALLLSSEHNKTQIRISYCWACISAMQDFDGLVF